MRTLRRDYARKYLIEIGTGRGKKKKRWGGGGVKWSNKLESLDMLSILLTLTIYLKKFVEEVDFMSPFLSHQTEGSLDSLTLPQILSFFSSPWQKHGETFSESEVPLRYHLWGMKFFFFLTCLEWFQHIQASSWQGHKPVNLAVFPFFPRALLTPPFSFSTSPSKEVQLFIFISYLLPNSAACELRGVSCFRGLEGVKEGEGKKNR